MPWTLRKPPKVATNWTLRERRRCVRAANRALAHGRSEQEAIFACIGAAGHSTKQVDEEGYEEITEESTAAFEELIALYFAGVITLSVLRARFISTLELFFTRLMLLGLDGRDPTQTDIDFLNRKMAEHEERLEVFLASLAAGEITPARALWRAGLYGNDREAYIYYTVPAAVVALMPGLPGEICLGNGLCGCHLDISFDNDGNAIVFWIVDPRKESCDVCLAMEASSPFTFSQEELLGV